MQLVNISRFFQLLIVLFPAYCCAFSILVKDVDRRQLSIAYRPTQFKQENVKELERKCFNKLEHMSQLYPTVVFNRYENNAKDDIDYYLDIAISKVKDGWDIQYRLTSAWVEGPAGLMASLSYQSLQEPALLYTTRSFFDLVIHKLFEETGVFEYPMAFVEKKGDYYHIVQSDALLEYEQSLFKTLNPITHLVWDSAGEGLYFTEIGQDTTSLKYIDITSNHQYDLYSSSLINSPVISHKSHRLYFIADFSHIPHIYQLNLNNHHLKSLSSGPLWVGQISSVVEPSDLLVTTNRSGQPQVYQFSSTKGGFEKQSTGGHYAASGQKISNGDLLFTSFDNDQHLSLYRQTKNSRMIKQLTHDIDIDKVTALVNPHIFALSGSNPHGHLGLYIYNIQHDLTYPLPSENPRSSLVFAPAPSLSVLMKI